MGTKQPSIARLESGSDLPRLSFLRRVVEALGGRVLLPSYDNGHRVSAQRGGMER